MFPLMNLPLVPVRDIMAMMDVSELMRISSCNKKIREEAECMKQVKSFYFLSYEQKEGMNCADVFELLQIHRHLDYTKFLRINPIDFKLIVGNNIGIEIRLKDDQLLKWNIFTEFIGNLGDYTGDQYFLRVEGEIIPAILTKKSELFTFWDDRLEGLKTLIAWIRRSFNACFETFQVEPGVQKEYSKELRSIVNFVNYRQQQFVNVMIDERRTLMSYEDMKFVAENVAAYKKYSHLGRSYEKGPCPRKIETKSLLITDSYWFTLDHLSMTDCVSIRLIDSSLNIHDLTMFIVKVLSGGFPNLKHIIVKTFHKNWVSCLFFKTIACYRKRGFIADGVFRSINNELVPIHIGAVIESLDGKITATVMIPWQSEHPNKLKTFEMVIWPDLEGFGYDRNVVHVHGLGR